MTVVKKAASADSMSFCIFSCDKYSINVPIDMG